MRRNRLDDVADPTDAETIEMDQLDWEIPHAEARLRLDRLNARYAQEMVIKNLREHFGDATANSELGAHWVTPDPESGSAPLDLLFDHVMKIPMQRWPTVRMNVSMRVATDPRITKTVDEKTEAGKKRKREAVEKLKKPRRKSVPSRKNHDLKLAKAKSVPTQIGIDTLIRRQQARAAEAADLDDAMERDDDGQDGDEQDDDASDRGDASDREEESKSPRP